MQINVTFTTQVKAALGCDQETVTLDTDATVLHAIQALGAKYPDVFSQFVLANDQLMPSILCSLNDQQVAVNAPVADGDRLLLLSAISGG